MWHASEDRAAPVDSHAPAFSGITSYDQIAAACEVSVGTVRSRLAQARAKMAEALLATAGVHTTVRRN
jgi:RNA polymerase sigma-70 factor, ECF subfamily